MNLSIVDNQFDFSKNSITLDVAAKEFANQKIHDIFKIILEESTVFSCPKSIFFGGSIARCEPSLRYENHKPVAINSDIDLYLVVENVAVFEQKTLEEFNTKIRMRTNGVDVSATIVPKFILESPKLTPYGGPTWSSTYAGIMHPLLYELDVAVPSPPKLNFFGALDVFVTRLTHVVLGAHLTTLGNNIICDKVHANYLSLKLIFDTLLLHVDYQNIQCQYGNQLLWLEYKNIPIINKLCPYSNVMFLIKAIEQFDPLDSLPQFNLINFIEDNLTECLNISVNHFISFLQVVLLKTKEIDTLYIKFLLANFLACLYKITNNNIYKTKLVDFIQECQTPGILSSNEITYLLATLTKNTESINQILILLVAKRRLLLKNIIINDNNITSLK